MADLQTNFNVAPFYDDYDENKQYYRILFRPATAVQARELTQLQTILQKQISRFGDSVYQDGSIIEGCNFTTYPKIKQIKFKDSNNVTIDFITLTTTYTDVDFDANGNTVNASNTFLLVSNTTGLRAGVFRAFEGSEANIPDTNRAYVQYITSGVNGESEFNIVSEQLDVYNKNQDKHGPLNNANKLGVLYTLSSNSTVNALGIGFGMHVGPGTIYQKGFFLKNLPQNFILTEHYSNAAGFKVGFDTKEYIIQEAQDPSLFDNSIGSTNYSAPGAWRLKLVPVPTFYNASNTSVAVPVNFLSVVDFDGGDGRAVVNNINPQYSTLGDTLANRVFETAGDFMVKSFQLDVVSHESNTQAMYYVASPGIAYVDGYRVEYQAPRRVYAPRAISTASFPNDSLRMSLGSYYYVNECCGVLDTQNLQEITFYDAPQQTLSIYLERTNFTGNVLGKANVRAFKFYDGVHGTPTARYLIYIFNVRMTGNPANIRSIGATSSTYGNFYADIVPDPISGLYTTYDDNLKRALYDTGLTGLQSLVDASNNNGTTFSYRPLLNTNLVPTYFGSSATFTLPGPDTFSYGVGFLDDPTSQDVYVSWAQDSLSTTVVTGVTISSSNSTTSTISSMTPFTAGLYVGDALAITNTAISATNHVSIDQVLGTTSLVVKPPLNIVDTPGGFEIKQFFKKGSRINFIGSGNTVQENSTTSLTVNLCVPPLNNNYNVIGQIPVTRNTAQPIGKVVMKNQYVKIDCSTSNLTGPWSLGISDVYKIANVFVGTTYSESNPDYGSWFILNNGQQPDTYYNSTMYLDPQYNGNLTNTSKLLVKFHCFTANITTTQAGFFSVDSYPIDDAAPSTDPNAIATAEIPVFTDTLGNKYDLRNYIDFRNIMANTALVTNVISSATINPVAGNTVFFTGGGNQKVFDPGSVFNYNATYYLPRKDYVVIDKNSNLQVKLGQPSNKPQFPALNKSGLVIAEVLVPPYPSLTFKEAE